MTLKYEVRTKQTIDTINQLLDDGIKKISALIRHSDRFFTEDEHQEPFMGLTDIGKDLAFDFGTTLRPNPLPKLYSSFMGRCIETAFLIDKGFTEKHFKALDHNSIDPMLSPFYVKNIEKAIPVIKKQGHHKFLRNWFDNCIEETIMENPQKTSELLCEFMVDKIKNLNENQMALCASHDWNIFPVKEFKLGLQHETAGDIGYLDAVIFFEKNGNYYITNFQANPIKL